jgi:hypothetical protein
VVAWLARLHGISVPEQLAHQLRLPFFLVLTGGQPHTTLENITVPSLLQGLIAMSSTSNTSHCFAEKNVLGPTAWAVSVNGTGGLAAGCVCEHTSSDLCVRERAQYKQKLPACTPGGPKSGGTTTRLCPPGFMPFIPISNPAHSPRLITALTWCWFQRGPVVPLQWPQALQNLPQ